jgi:cyclopropane fatty-acyl-phospholipid synthase-like methyltransferase
MNAMITSTKSTTIRSVLAALAIAAAATPALLGQQSTITPTARELNKSFDADPAQWAGRFEHEGRAIYDKRYEILDELALRPGLDVADIGAGSGLFSRLIAQRVAPGGTVYAVDIAKNMVDHVAKTAREQNIANLKAVLGTPRSPSLPPGSMDRVVIVDSYHHFEFPAEMLAEIKKALKPDGLFVLVDFKRIEGVSQKYILSMVRAGQGTFTDEIQNAGFELIERNEHLLEDNYILKFRHRKTAPPSPTGGR